MVRLLNHKSAIQTQLLQLMEARRNEEDGYEVLSDLAFACIDLFESSVGERELYVKIYNLQMKENAKVEEQLRSLMHQDVMYENAISMIKTVGDLSKCAEVRQGVMSYELMEIRSSCNKNLFWALLTENMKLWDDKLRGNVNDSDEVHEYISVRLRAFGLDLDLDVIEEIFSFLCKQIPSNEAIDEKVKAGIMTRFDSFFFWLLYEQMFRCSMEDITEYVKIEFDKLDALFAKQVEENKFGTEIVPTQCPEHYLNTWAKEAMLMVRKSDVRWLVMVFFVLQFLFCLQEDGRIAKERNTMLKVLHDTYKDLRNRVNTINELITKTHV